MRTKNFKPILCYDAIFTMINIPESEIDEKGIRKRKGTHFHHRRWEDFSKQSPKGTMWYPSQGPSLTLRTCLWTFMPTTLLKRTKVSGWTTARSGLTVVWFRSSDRALVVIAVKGRISTWLWKRRSQLPWVFVLLIYTCVFLELVKSFM